MKTFYTVEQNVQVLISLLKQYNIHNVVVSPGTTNITFVASIQQDSTFRLYSAADERSAGYIACGIAEESGEPVVLTCTGATASRNYIPSLTEAFYRQLPVIAVTSTQFEGKIGTYTPQVLDRSQIQKDIAVFHTYLPSIKDKEDYDMVLIRANKAMHALYRRGGGPIHIDLETHYNRDFTVKELPVAKKINYYDSESELPPIPEGRIAIYIGNHRPWNKEDVSLIDRFCAQYNGIVVCDHASNYFGKYAVSANLFTETYIPFENNPVLRIHIGCVTAAGPGLSGDAPREWRVNKDGEIRDRWNNTECVFEMSEHMFFTHYVTKEDNKTEYLDKCISSYKIIYEQFPELPFSNVWVAKTLAPRLPRQSVVHLGILNTIRCWDLFLIDKSIRVYYNSGGFGIDGVMSSAIGGAIINPNQIHYCFLGDLAFFYDMNSLANRHVGNNLRILMINNGCGTEFKNYMHFASSFGDDGSPYMAAMGHYGNKSRYLVRHYTEDLGLKYLCADSKESFLKNVDTFLDESINQSMVFEVFTEWKDESDAIQLVHKINPNVNTIRNKIKSALPNSVVEVIRDIIH